ncbi:hypothetical protein, partial [Streptomyces niveiscabiei]|uniref:hypothetical protein n=1 Tax=Streptomyces niveiscabiei TaxID=164115 RepID=UPI0038F7BDC9
ATQYGLFYSDDDGDTWYRPTTSNTAGFDHHISSARHFNDPATLNQGGYLAQTFTITSEAGTPPHTLKISAYLSLTPDDGQIQNYTA